MKQDSIQHLLAKRQAGTLTDSELQELNRLTHKDEVVAAAEQASANIVRRRRLVSSTVAMVAIAVGVIGITTLVPSNETPLVAQQQSIPQTVVVEEKPQTVEAAVETAITRPVVTKNTAVPVTHPVEKAIRPEVVKTVDPTVVCNNQCEADSVINDIWKFLTA